MKFSDCKLQMKVRVKVDGLHSSGVITGMNAQYGTIQIDNAYWYAPHKLRKLKPSPSNVKINTEILLELTKYIELNTDLRWGQILHIGEFDAGFYDSSEATLTRVRSVNK